MVKLQCKTCCALRRNEQESPTTAIVGDLDNPTFFVGRPQRLIEGIDSSIARQKLLTEVMLNLNGFVGDEVADKRYHGGPDRALLVVSRKSYKRLAIEGLKFNKDWPSIDWKSGLFGENLSVNEFSEPQVKLGDRFSLGAAIVEVNQPRSPCFKLDIFTRVPGFAQIIQQLGCGGWFLRVIQPGTVNPKSRLKLLSRSQEALTVAETNCLFYHQSTNRHAWEVLNSQSALSHSWRVRIHQRMKTGIVESWDARLHGTGSPKAE